MYGEEPLASEWSDEKNVCIDWTDPTAVRQNGFTFLQLLAAHPKLDSYFATAARKEEKESAKKAFNGSVAAVDIEPLLRQWRDQQLLCMRSERWCRRCGRSGHTSGNCVTARDTSSSSPHEVTGATPQRLTVLEKFKIHTQFLERKRALEDKQKGGRGGGGTDGGQNRRRGNQAGKGFAITQGSAQQENATSVFVDERRRGVVSRIDTAIKIGFISIPGSGEIKFFLDRVDVGLREVAVGDSVTLKEDNSRDYPIAVDVRLEKATTTATDVRRFLQRCRQALDPMQHIITLLSHQAEWFLLARWMASLMDKDMPQMVQAVHIVVELITFAGNRTPIHVPLLEGFLRLMCTATPVAAWEIYTAPEEEGTSVPASQSGSSIPFFPDLLLAALKHHEAPLPEEKEVVPGQAMALLCDQWIEVAEFVLLLRHFTADDDIKGKGTLNPAGGSAYQASEEEVILLLNSFFTKQMALGNGRIGAMERTQRRLQMAYRHMVAFASVNVTDEDASFSIHAELLPSSADLSVPPPNPNSAFSPSKLPVAGREKYSVTATFIRDQWRLLRADVFESTCRLLCGACFKLPGNEVAQDTLSDLAHARVFDHVQCLGKVVTRDRDFSHPLSYILEVHPRSTMAMLRPQLSEGTTVCISTGISETAVEKDEVFWATVSSADSALLAANAIVVTPCPGSASLEALMKRLQRNLNRGRPERSILIETPVFMAGYTSIARALGAFIGPLAMPLPLSRILVSEAAAAAEAEVAASMQGARHKAASPAVSTCSGSQRLIEYIPPHCADAFGELVADVRARFRLDEGQEQVMKGLSTSPVLLVQGPPGTGKSFIGCRVVETYVRYKQAVASGEILQKVNVDLLRWTAPADLMPHVGPIVVITYKNHALDEFLMDLLDSGLWDSDRSRGGQNSASGEADLGGVTVPAGTGTAANYFPNGRRLVRIGGRSQEARLDAHNLGTLERGSSGRAALNSFRDRLFVMNQRLERLTKEIHYLEQGRVPRAYFERWLTPDQRRSMNFEQRESWLAGENYISPSGRSDMEAEADTSLFRVLLKTRIAEALEQSKTPSTVANPKAGRNDAAVEAGDEEDGVALSVFQAMRKEEERCDFNDALHSTYLSAEAIRLAAVPPSKPEEVPEELLSLWSLHPTLRHHYYAYLIQSTIAAKARDCLTIMEAMRSLVTIRNHAADEVKLSLLRGADVIGLTTTGCAMNQNLLRSLRPSVLVVEEAAEVLESQLIACMTDSLKQIVLIGDHYQLQPKVDTYLYEKVNRMNLSLFERLAGSLAPIRLTEQRRMHPELSRLVRPFYAPQPLIDHESLFTRPFLTAFGGAYVDRVPGLAQRAFFWRHHHPEEEAPGSRSKVNTLEISMVQELVGHLTRQGVPQQSITVITPYLGQRRLLRGILRVSSYSDVRVSTVDLYQGDENDIIILSLVRTEKLTDFIRTRNRLIVSCSRARFGMVIVGNDTLLRQCGHWADVLKLLDESGCVGDKLPITSADPEGPSDYLVVKENASAAALERELHADPRRQMLSRLRADNAAKTDPLASSPLKADLSTLPGEQL